MAECCQQEIDLLKQNLEQLTLESKKLKESYQNLLVENLQKDINIRRLKKELSSSKYSGFKDIFSDSCLDSLRSIGDSQREDCTFIGLALRDLYRENIDDLKLKTLSGRSKDSEKIKTEISPKKIETLERLFCERISNLPSAEVDDIRKKNLRKHIRNAIDSVNRKK